MKINPNAPAYPVSPWVCGLTIRAEFAARFMPAVNSEGYDRGQIAWYVEAALEQADALIAALNADEKEDYLVLDSRAEHDTEAASILEACGHKRPSSQQLQKDWGRQGAVLVRWFGWDGKAYTKEEIVERIP